MGDLNQRVLADLDDLDEIAMVAFGWPRMAAAGQWVRLWDKRDETPCGPWHRVLVGGAVSCVADGSGDPRTGVLLAIATDDRRYALLYADGAPWDACRRCLHPG